MIKLLNILKEEDQPEDKKAIPGDVSGKDQVHVFDFDDTLGLTSNANGIMLYNDGKPVHKSEKEVRDWMSKLGLSDKDLLDPKIKKIPERDGAYAIYVTSAALAKVQKEYPSEQQGVTGVKDVPKKGEAILIDFTPSASTDPSTTKPIKPTIDKLKKANSQGSDTIVITARQATGKGKDFAGKDVSATNAKDLEDFLSKQGAKPSDGVMGVSGQDKGQAIVNKYIKGDKPPKEIHFYDDLKKNTDQVKAAIANKQPAELFVYGPGEFAHGEADPNKPNEKFAAAVKEAVRKRLVKEYNNKKTIKISELTRIFKEEAKKLKGR